MTEEKAIVKSEVPIVNGLITPRDFDGMWRIANMYAKSGMVPKQYVDNPAAIIVAGQFGAELGLSLMPSLQGVAVINGNPTLWGDVMIGIVRNSGTLEVFVEFYQGKALNDDYTAICIAKRSGVGFGEYSPDDDLDTMRRKGFFVNEYSVDDAKRAGLWGGKGKEQWQKEQSPWFTNPKRMLKMRARSFTLRDGWPDILKGMHSVEEMMDAVDVIEVKGRTVESKPQSSEQIEHINPMVSDEELAERFDNETTGVADYINELDAWLLKIAQTQNMTLIQAKAEVMRENDLENCLKSFAEHMEANKPKEQAPEAKEEPKPEPEPIWNPEEALPMQRYTPDKAEILKARALELGIDVKGKLPREVHTAILVATKPQEEAVDPETHERFNQLWVACSKMAKQYASDEMALKTTINGYTQPPKERMAEWIKLVEDYEANMEKM